MEDYSSYVRYQFMDSESYKSDSESYKSFSSSELDELRKVFQNKQIAHLGENPPFTVSTAIPLIIRELRASRIRKSGNIYYDRKEVWVMRDGIVSYNSEENQDWKLRQFPWSDILYVDVRDGFKVILAENKASWWLLNSLTPGGLSAFLEKWQIYQTRGDIPKTISLFSSDKPTKKPSRIVSLLKKAAYFFVFMAIAITAGYYYLLNGQPDMCSARNKRAQDSVNGALDAMIRKYPELKDKVSALKNGHDYITQVISGYINYRYTGNENIQPAPNDKTNKTLCFLDNIGFVINADEVRQHFITIFSKQLGLNIDNSGQ